MSQTNDEDASRRMKERTISSLVEVDVSGLSDRGAVRMSNDDYFLVVRFARSLQALMTNMPEASLPQQSDEVGYALVVADGISGMAGGEFASRIAISTLVSLVLDTPDWMMRLGDREMNEVMRRMEDRFQKINETLIEQSALDSAGLRTQTTMTVAANLGADMVIAHVGDSRAYLLRGGVLHRLTRDHTLAEEMIAGGVISPLDDTAVRRFRKILTQSLGAKGLELKPDVQRSLLADGDQVLLCTDGLTDVVDDETIGQVLKGAHSASEACRSLIDLALRLGSTENMTAVVARYRFSPELKNSGLRRPSLNA